MARPYRLVIVDDNPGDLQIFAEAMIDANWKAELDRYDSGHAALDSLRGLMASGRVPDLILLDYLLKGERCVHTLAMIRALPRFDRVPIIIYSSSMPTATMIEECEPFGVLRILEKPHDFTGTISLVRVLRSFLVGHGAISAGGSWKDPGAPASSVELADPA